MCTNDREEVSYKKELMKYFHPSENNEGTVVAVCGDDFAIIGNHTRHNIKFAQFDKVVVAATGWYFDFMIFIGKLELIRMDYKRTHQCEMPASNIASAIQQMLNCCPSDPYCICTVLAGLEWGVGCVFAFPCLSSFTKKKYAVSGSAAPYLFPYLQSYLGHDSLESCLDSDSLTEEEALDILIQVFVWAVRSNIISDGTLTIKVIKNNGIREEIIEVKR